MPGAKAALNRVKALMVLPHKGLVLLRVRAAMCAATGFWVLLSCAAILMYSLWHFLLVICAVMSRRAFRTRASASAR